MAQYNDRFIFCFSSQGGPEVTIAVSQSGYTGAALRRSVGGAARLRRSVSGHILATSLEWSAESLEEDEFADLYTTDPTLYRVTLSFGQTPVWRGFITPELYAAPWVNAPFDVSLTASDNLAELKNSDFEALGDVKVGDLLASLLSATGQDGLTIGAVSSLTGDGKSLLNLTVNVDHLAGESRYDVLNKVLESFHANIYLDFASGRWVVARETDTADDVRVEYIGLGSLNSAAGIFPVGNMSMEIVPARKALTVAEEIVTGNVAKEFSAANFGTVSGQPKWSVSSLGNTARLTRVPPSSLSGGEGRIDAIAGVVFPRLVAGHRYKLTFFARNAGFFVGTTMLKFGIVINGGNETKLYYREGGGYTTAYPGDDFPIPITITSTEFGEYSFEFAVPDKVGTATFAPQSGSFSARAIREGDGANIWDAIVQLAAVTLSVTDLPDGFTTKVVLDNDARSSADDVDLQFGADLAKSRDNIIKETVFKSAAVTASDINTFTCLDNALSCAVPRLRLSGVVRFKSAALWRLPQNISTLHLTATNLKYICEDYDFDLLTGDIDISMISLPAAQLEYKEVTTKEVYGAAYKGGTSSGSSSPGAPGTAAGFGTPTATAVALPSGSAPTVSVAASGPDTAKIFAFTFGLPQGSSGAAVDIAARLATPPRLVLRSGNNEDQTYPEGIEVSHPMLGQSGYEAVLMVYGKNSRRSGVSSGGSKLRVHKLGWAVALGNLPLTGHVPLTGTASVIGVNYGLKLLDLRNFIVKRFCCDAQYSASQLYARDYAQWIFEKRNNRGFNTHSDASRLFGVAVRCENPDFNAKLTAGKELKATTQMIGDTPRYLYSPVAPLRAVWSSSVPTERYKDVLGFSLTY